MTRPTDVRALHEAGWMSACDDHLAVSAFAFALRDGAKPHMAFDVRSEHRHVQVSVSPTGRSVRVWVDGVEIER